jgi:uncharacterized membrane protein YedE/YeeE
MFMSEEFSGIKRTPEIIIYVLIGMILAVISYQVAYWVHDDPLTVAIRA